MKRVKENREDFSCEERTPEGNCITIDKSKLDVPYDLLALRVPKQHSGHVSKLLSGLVKLAILEFFCLKKSKQIHFQYVSIESLRLFSMVFW